jgi:hypothetical protein
MYVLLENAILFHQPGYIIRVMKSRRKRRAEYVARMGRREVLVRKPDGKRPLGRPRRRFEYNIKIDLQEVGWGGKDRIYLVEDRDRWRGLTSVVMSLRVPDTSNGGSFFTS